MFHQECGGGKIEEEYGDYPAGRELTCQRCEMVVHTLDEPEEGVMKIIKTAIDGEERKIKDKYSPEVEIIVIQRT